MGKKQCAKSELLIPELKKIFPDEKAALEKDFRDDVTISKELPMRLVYNTRGSVRIALGRYKTKDEYEAWRKQVLAHNLP